MGFWRAAGSFARESTYNAATARWLFSGGLVGFPRKTKNADWGGLLTIRVLCRGSVYVGFASESDQTADTTRGRLWAMNGHRLGLTMAQT
jgi:hypothetical protein